MLKDEIKEELLMNYQVWFRIRNSLIPKEKIREFEEMFIAISQKILPGFKSIFFDTSTGLMKIECIDQNLFFANARGPLGIKSDNKLDPEDMLSLYQAWYQGLHNDMKQNDLDWLCSEMYALATRLYGKGTVLSHNEVLGVVMITTEAKKLIYANGDFVNEVL